MARGRMISNDITRDKRINDLSDDTSRLAFTWLITFADSEGKTYGDPALVRSMLFPRRVNISIEQMEEYIQEWHDIGLVVWYEAQGDKWIWFPKFEKHQIGLRKDREAPSAIPEPPASYGETPEEIGDNTPDEIPPNSGPTPDEIPVKLKEEKLIELNNGASAPPAAPDPPEVQVDKVKIRQELQKHFLVKTGLPAPKSKTNAQIKETQKLWWGPLLEIAELAAWDTRCAEGLIDTSLKKLDGMTISDPNSIVKTARAVYAEAHRLPAQSSPVASEVF